MNSKPTANVPVGTPSNTKHLKSANGTDRYQQQRQKAIDAAASVFATKGYHGASTKDIAAHLGIRQGSLYYYFNSKESALEEVCLSALNHYLEKMTAVFKENSSFEDKLRAIIHAHLSSYREHSAALKVHNEQRLYLPKQRREKLKQLGSSYRSQLEQVFLAEIQSGRLNEHIDSHFTALSLIGLCNYWGAMLSREPKLNLESIIDQCTELVLNSCRRNTGSNHATKH
jgi:AcrR family transcriptional regulator